MAARRKQRYFYRVTSPTGRSVTYRKLTNREMHRLIDVGYQVQAA